MTRWQQGLESLESALGHGAGGRWVERVEARKDGSLIWTVRNGDVRWFRSRGFELDELHLRQDEGLPAARRAPANGVLAYRPGRRAAWLDPDGGRVWKALRRGREEQAAARVLRVQEALDESCILRTPSLDSVRRDESALCLHRVGGVAPVIRVRGTRSWERIGAGLRELQTRVPIEGLQLHDRAAELEVIVNLRTRVLNVRGELPAGFDEALAGIETVQDALPAGTGVAAHRDLHDANLLVDGDRVWLLDLDLLCAADATLDLGNLSAHLVLRALQEPERVGLDAARACARALLAGYGALDSEGLRAGLRLYQATTFARLALLYAVRPRWTHLAEPLVDHARAAVAEVSLG